MPKGAKFQRQLFVWRISYCVCRGKTVVYSRQRVSLGLMVKMRVNISFLALVQVKYGIFVHFYLL